MRFAHVGCALLALGAAGCERLQTPAQRAERAARDSLVRDSTARVVMLREADSLHLRTRVAEWSLPDMRTTGGITLTSDGRLLVADGESGNVAQIDYRNGAVLKAFKLGRQTIHDDFVGIATTGNGDVFELTKTGTIYHFLEGSDGNRVEFLKHDTKLAGVCEFGGLAFSRERNALLLACSVMKHRGDSLAFYWWALAAKDEDRLSSFRVATTTHPAGVAIDPFGANYVLLSSTEAAAITPAGRVVYSVTTPQGLEGVRGLAITRGGALLVAMNTSGGAKLARYAWR